MSPQEIDQLKSELQALRKENRRLRAVAHLNEGEPTPERSPLQRHDNLLPAFNQQLQRLQKGNEQLQQALQHYGEMEKSLQALLPALEVQLTGWANEIRLLHEAQQDTENTYASVVDRLEERLKEARWQLERQRQEAQKKVAVLEERNQALQAQMAAQKAPQPQAQAPASSENQTPSPTQAQPSDPFTSLNIFGI